MSRFCWFEHVSGDPARAQGFYGELFGWTTVQVPVGDTPYAMIHHGERRIGGYFAMPGAPTGWLPYLQVAEVRAAVARVRELGGRIVRDVHPAGALGQLAIVEDPQGAAFALWQAASPAPEPPRSDGDFCWYELLTAAPAAAAEFYRALTGFTVEAMDVPGVEGAYHVLSAGGAPRCGVTATVANQRAGWLSYVQVAAIDDAAARAVRLGGRVVVPPEDVPGIGRYAVIEDPLGGALGLLQPPAA